MRNYYEHGGLVGIMITSHVENQGSIPSQVRPKTLKNGTQCLSAKHSAYRSGLRVNVFLGTGIGVVPTLLKVEVIEIGAFGSPLTVVNNFMMELAFLTY